MAGCGSSGAFVECGAVSKDERGDVDEDRCVALSGVSSGCGAESGSGDTKASAKCDLSGSGQGCGSSASSEGKSAGAWCSGGSDCGQSARADRGGASADCESGSGTCCIRGSSPTDDADDPPGRKPDRSVARCPVITRHRTARRLLRVTSSQLLPPAQRRRTPPRLLATAQRRRSPPRSGCAWR